MSIRVGDHGREMRARRARVKGAFSHDAALFVRLGWAGLTARASAHAH